MTGADRVAGASPEVLPPKAEVAADATPEWRRVHAFELVSYLALIAAVLTLRAFGLRQDWSSVQYMLPRLAWPVGQVLVWGVGVHVAVRLLARRDVRRYVRELLLPGSMLLLARTWAALMALWYAYPWIKVSVPLLNPRLWDRELWNLDRALHGGFSPTLFLGALFDQPIALLAVDGWYSWWLVSSLIATGIFAAWPDLRVRRRFVLSTVVLWTLGLWGYVAVPALGPCYANPEAMRDLRGKLPNAQSLQISLGENYANVVARRDGERRPVKPFLGVAAMPSLHVGVHWLLALWTRTLARRLFPFALIAALLTLVASVVTGWHYLVDGYAGIALAHVAHAAGEAIERTPRPTAPVVPLTT